MKNGLYPPTILIKNAGFLDSWALGIYAVNKFGMEIQGEPCRENQDPQLTRDACVTFEFTEGAIDEIFAGCLHPAYPQQHGLIEYVRQYEIGTPEYIHANESKDKFDYTYTGRMRRTPKCPNYGCEGVECWGYKGRCYAFNGGAYTEDICYFDQLKYISEHLEPFNRRLQAITWDRITDLGDESAVPCLQRIQLRNLGNGCYECFMDWRSRDLGKAYMWNMVALISSIDKLIQDYRIQNNLPPLKLVKITDRPTCCHIYMENWNIADKIVLTAKLISECVYV